MMAVISNILAPGQPEFQANEVIGEIIDRPASSIQNIRGCMSHLQDEPIELLRETIEAVLEKPGANPMLISAYRTVNLIFLRNLNSLSNKKRKPLLHKLGLKKDAAGPKPRHGIKKEHTNLRS